MEESFVSFELAEKLKEKGFWYKTETFYDEDGGIGLYLGHKPCFEHDLYSRPTISQVLKWLREEKGIHIELTASAFGYSYIISKTPELGGTDIKFSEYDGPNDGGAWDELEYCAVAAIEYVLDNLI